MTIVAGTIYITRDPHLEEILERAAAMLAADGWQVIRGPEITPGVPLVLSPQQRIELLAAADIIVVSSRSRLTGDDLDAAPRLKGLVFPTIGVDAVDLGECARRGLIVGHGAMPENFLAMSEATVMLMLVLLYRLHETERLLRHNQPRPNQMHARMLRGRRIGLIGVGRIGGGVADRLRNWGVEIVGCDPYVTPDAVPEGVRLIGKEELLGSCDVVSLHVPLNAETRNLIGETELLLMKSDAILVNTARGGLIDEDALVRVMRRGHLAGAGIDVFETEPLAKDDPLRHLDRVILTPHMIGHTSELYAATPDVLVENVRRVARGELPLHTKNPEAEGTWRERLAKVQ